MVDQKGVNSGGGTGYYTIAMFMFKKIVAPFLFPVPICLEILIVGLILLWFIRKEKAGKILVTIGVILLAVLSYGGVPNTFLRPLEYKYPSLLRLENLSDVRWVVVLGGGHNSDPKVPITSQLSGSTLPRLIEGIRLHKLLPDSKLVLSGGSAFDPVPNAKLMGEMALSIGVEESNLILEQASKDTKDEAVLVKEIVGDDRFILVTSASHMPRSMALFRKQGMNPIPAPTDHQVKERQGRRSPGSFFPSPGALRNAEVAFYEYLGFAWGRIRGQI